MESINVVQIIEDYNYILEHTNQMVRELNPGDIIALLELAYEIGMIEGDVEDDKSNGE